MVDDAELLELVEMEVRELLRATSSRATTSRSSRARRWRRWKGDDPEIGEDAILELMTRWTPTSRSRSVRWTSRS